MPEHPNSQTPTPRWRRWIPGHAARQRETVRVAELDAFIEDAWRGIDRRWRERRAATAVRTERGYL